MKKTENEQHRHKCLLGELQNEKEFHYRRNKRCG